MQVVNIEGAMLVFHRCYPSLILESIRIEVKLWVRVSGIPVAFMKKEIVMELLKPVGMVVLVEVHVYVISPV